MRVTLRCDHDELHEGRRSAMTGWYEMGRSTSTRSRRDSCRCAKEKSISNQVEERMGVKDAPNAKGNFNEQLQ